VRTAFIVIATTLALVGPLGTAMAATPPEKSASAKSASAKPASPRPATLPQPPADWKPDAGLGERLRSAEPAIADWLTRIHGRLPQRERFTLWQFSEDEHAIAKLRKEDPSRIAAVQKRGRLEREVAMLVDDARQAKGEERVAATAKAQARMKDLLAARDEVRTEQLASLHHRVADMEKERSTGTPHAPKQ
jgi:hypothetical protein